MLRPKEMTKLVAVGGKKDLPAVIDTLYSLKALHIKEHRPAEFDIGEPLEVADEISEVIIKTGAILALWDIGKGDASAHSDTTKQTIKQIHKIHAVVQKQEEQLRLLQEESQELKKQLHNHKVLSKLGVKKEYTTLNTVDVLTGVVKDKSVLKKLPHSTHTEIAHTYAAVAVPKEEREEILQEITQKGFTEVQLGVQEDEKVLNKQFKEVIAQKRAAEQELLNTKKEHSEYVRSAAAYLEQEAEKAAIPLTFAASENMFYVTGFVPTEEVLVVKQALDKATKKRIFIQTLEEKNQLEIPIQMNHPQVIKDFQFFQNLYALPRYKELDPTFFTFMTFPLLFGFMLGDIGYGIITLILFWLMKRWMPDYKGFFNIIILASIWTIVFGIFFGKFFGSNYLFGWDLPRLLHRLYDVMEVLYLSLFIGVLHINFGLAIGFWNELKSHGIWMAILEKASWWMLQIGIFFVALPYVAQTLSAPETTGPYWLFQPIITLATLTDPLQPWLGFGILALGVVMIILGEGVVGAVEIPAIVSNILSYARMFAIGMAKASLAVVINSFANGFMLSMGWWGLIPTTLLLVVGHGINIMLGLLGGFLHSLRLHYVEFYSRFYKGGGKKYSPFGAK